METTLTRRGELAARTESTAGIAAEDFEAIVRLHQRRIYRVVLALVRDPDAADTLTQECFLRAYRKRASFRGESSVATWLVRIAVNLAIDHARNRRQAFWSRLLNKASPGDRTDSSSRSEAPIPKLRDPGEAARFAEEELADQQASPERTLLAREQLAAVWSVVEELSPQQRAIFLLRFAEEMTMEEIAQSMGLEVGTVKAHLHRGISAVRRRLRESMSKLTRS